MGIFDEIIEGLFNLRLKGARQAVKHVMSKYYPDRIFNY
jgi:hypothetical protein